MGRARQTSKTPYLPSPLSSNMTRARDIEVPPRNLEPAVDQSDPQDLSLIADIAAIHLSDPSPEVLPENQRPASTPKVRSVKSVARSVPNYWNAARPLKGETRQESAAAAQRARYRALKDRSFIRELANRNYTLDKDEYPSLERLGTPSFPVGVNTGRFKVPASCVRCGCRIFNNGWTPEIYLAAEASKILRTALERLDWPFDGATTLESIRYLIEQRRKLYEEERRRAKQVLILTLRQSIARKQAG